MNEPLPVPPRRRLQELLAIPDRLRTEAEWDELHELEISLAPGNRADGAPQPPRSDGAPPRPRPRANAPSGHGNPRPNPRPNPHPRPNPPGEGGEGGEPREGRKSFRNRRKKPPKPPEAS